MYNILEKVFFGDTLVLKFRNIQFWNDLIIGGVKYMYEQDYIIRMNNEVIRTMVKLLLNKDTGVPVNISEGTIKSENKKMLEDANGQSGIDNIKKMEEEIEYRKLVVRKDAIEAVKDARAQGDLSENFEYYAAKRDKNKNEGRIRYLERMIKTAKVISDESNDDEVGLNNTITVYFEEDDEEDTYKIVTTVRSLSLIHI